MCCYGVFWIAVFLQGVRDKLDTHKEGRQLKYLDPHKFMSVQIWHCCPLHIHPRINPYVRPSIIQPSLHLLSHHPFIHAVNQPSSRPTHTPLIRWLTLYWLDQSVLKWLLCKCLGTMARRYLCSSFPRQCRGLTWFNSSFSFNYIITPNIKKRARKKKLSNKQPTYHTKRAAVHANLPAMT